MLQDKGLEDVIQFEKKAMGFVLLGFSVLLIIAHFLVPIFAPVALAILGLLFCFNKQLKAGLIFLAITVLVFLLRGFIGYVLLVTAAVLFAVGVFYIAGEHIKSRNRGA